MGSGFAAGGAGAAWAALGLVTPACPAIGLGSNGGILSGPGGSRVGGLGDSIFARLAAGPLSLSVLAGRGRFATLGQGKTINNVV